MSYSKLKEKKLFKMMINICIALHIDLILRYILYFFWRVFDVRKQSRIFFQTNSDKVELILSLLEDDFSRESYKASLRFRSFSDLHSVCKVYRTESSILI